MISSRRWYKCWRKQQHCLARLNKAMCVLGVFGAGAFPALPPQWKLQPADVISQCRERKQLQGKPVNASPACRLASKWTHAEGCVRIAPGSLAPHRGIWILEGRSQCLLCGGSVDDSFWFQQQVLLQGQRDGEQGDFPMAPFWQYCPNSTSA